MKDQILANRAMHEARASGKEAPYDPNSSPFKRPTGGKDWTKEFGGLWKDINERERWNKTVYLDNSSVPPQAPTAPISRQVEQSHAPSAPMYSSVPSFPGASPPWMAPNGSRGRTRHAAAPIVLAGRRPTKLFNLVGIRFHAGRRAGT